MENGNQKKEQCPMEITAIIPAFNPSEQILTVVLQLCQQKFTKIIIVNDGSDERCLPIFHTLKTDFGCTILTHPCNKGKGQALKTAFRHYLDAPEKQLGVITLDDDGQHGIDDVIACANALVEHSNALVLGVCDFSSAQVPPKSKYGNRFIIKLFAAFYDVHITDANTGLRAIPNCWLPALTEVVGDKFEYEINMLLAANKNGIPIVEIPIQTIYHKNNEGTRFRPFKDSARIGVNLICFGISSVVSFGVDILLFWLISRLPLGDMMQRVFWATLISRAASSMLNFLLNLSVVFRQKNQVFRRAVRYYLLCAGQAMMSFLLVWGLGMLLKDQWLVPMKMVVDGMLFLISYRVQRHWVFRAKKNDDVTDK